jgi:hypothetical protein
VRAAPAYFDPLDFSAANIARLTRPAEDLHMELMSPLAAAAVYVVPKRGAAIVEGIAQDAADGAVESFVFSFA